MEHEEILISRLKEVFGSSAVVVRAVLSSAYSIVNSFVENRFSKVADRIGKESRFKDKYFIRPRSS